MKAKLLSTLAVGAFLAMAGVASANQPVTLNETQMDAVTAGGTATAIADALALGLAFATTATTALTSTTAIAILPIQGGQITTITSAAASSSQSAAQ